MIGEEKRPRPSAFNDHNSTWASELYEHRNVLRSLIKKNLVGRYQNSLFGFAWHFITPAIMLIVYYFTFSTIRGSSIENFWLYLGVGIFPFNFMISNLVGGATCITNNSMMVNKMYFPREILVLSQTISTAIVMIIGLLIVIILMIFMGIPFNPVAVLVMVFLLVVLFLFVSGYVFAFSSLNVYKRDVQYFLSSITIMFYFISPMYFMIDQLPKDVAQLVWLNPFTYFLEGFHDVLYRGIVPNSNTIFGCILCAAITLTVGLLIFSKLKRGFAERL